MELHGRYEVASTLDRHACLNYLDLTNQGTGGKMAQTLFVKRRSEAREAYTARIRECPELAFVDWSNAEIGGPTEGFAARQGDQHTGLAFSRVNLCGFSLEDLWFSYEHYNASQKVEVHWVMVRNVSNEWVTFRDRVAAARAAAGPGTGEGAGAPARRPTSRRRCCARLRRDVLAFRGRLAMQVRLVKGNGGRARRSSRRCDDRRARGLAAGAAHGRHRRWWAGGCAKLSKPTCFGRFRIVGSRSGTRQL